MADITMPQLGETVTEGTITKWFKQVGDQVAEDEALFEVSTDKVDSEVPSPVAGYADRDPRRRRATPSTSAPCSPSSATRPPAAAPAPAPRRPAAEAPAADEPAADAARAAPEPRPGGRGARPARGDPARAPRPPPGAAARAGSGRGAARRAGAGAGRRPGRPRRPAAGDGRAAVARRAPPHRRARPRPGHDRAAPASAGASPATTCSTRIDAGGDAARRPRPRPARRRAAGSCSGRPRRPAPAPGARRPRRPGRRRGQPAAPGERDTVVPLNNIRRLTGEHMVPLARRPRPTSHVRIEVDYEGVERVRRAAQGARSRPRRASASPTCRSSPGPWSTPSREFPHMNARVGDERADRAQLRRPRHRRRPRLRGPASSRSSTTPTASGCGPSPARSTTWPAGPAPRSSPPTTSPAARSPSPTPGRTGTLLVRCRSSTSRRWRSCRPTASSAGRSSSTDADGGEAIAIHSVGNLALAGTTGPSTAPTPPRSSHEVKEILETRDWEAELVTAVTRRSPLHVRWLGRVRYRDALRAPARAVRRRSADDHLLLLEHPHVYTLGVRRRPGATCSSTPAAVGAELRAGRPGRRRHLPRARPAGRLPDPHLPGKRRRRHGRHRRLRALGRAAGHRRARPTSASRRRPPRRATRACGSAPDGPRPARSPPSACGSAGAGRCTASPSTSTPTWRCSATSSRAASPTRRVTSLRRRGRRRHDARGRRRRRRPRRRALGQRRRRPRRRRLAPPRRRRPRRRSAAAPGAGEPVPPHGAGRAPSRRQRRRHVGAAARPAGRGRRAERRRRSPSASRSGCGPRSTHRRPSTCALKQHDARPRPGHRVRGGRLPEHLRVLGRRHRHVHDQRRALHPGVRLLPGRHPPPRAARPRRARAGRRGRRAHGPARTPWSPRVARDDLRRRRRGARSPPPSRPSGAARPARRSRC